jgi:hypothetical protein
MSSTASIGQPGHPGSVPAEPPPGPAAPSATSGQPPAGVDSAEAVATAISVRNQVVDRMRHASVKHAHHAWEQRYRDPLAPYALAFLYAQPAPAGGLGVAAATKLWLAGPETASLPRLLFDLNTFVGRRHHAGPFDLRTELANRVDRSMTDGAWYIGLGLSSLDTHTGSWEHVQQRTETVLDVPGRVLVVLTDQTTIVCERRGMDEYDAFQIHSTHTLGDAYSLGIYRWSWAHPDQLRSDPAHAAVLQWLDALNLTLWRADNARLVAAQTSHQGPGRRGR